MIRIMVRWLLTGLGMVACISCTPHDDYGGMQLVWHPQLAGAAAQFEALLSETEQQQHINLTSANLASVLDAELYVVFHEYLANIPPGQQCAAVDKQRKWLEYRSKVAETASTEYQGGTFASFAYSRSYCHVTRERMVELRSEVGKAPGIEGRIRER